MQNLKIMVRMLFQLPSRSIGTRVLEFNRKTIHSGTKGRYWTSRNRIRANDGEHWCSLHKVQGKRQRSN